MLYEECEYCKNHYDTKQTEGCARIWFAHEVDDDDMPIKVDGACCGFRRSGLFKDLPYVMTKNNLIDYIEGNFYRLMENYSANDLLNILHEDIADQVIAFMNDYFYDAAILNGVKIKEEEE